MTALAPAFDRRTLASVLVMILAAAAIVVSASPPNRLGRPRDWRANEYTSCSDVPTVCRSDLCDTTNPRSRLWNKWTGIDLMTHGTGTPVSEGVNRQAVGLALPDGTYLLVDAGSGIVRDLGVYKCQDWTRKLKRVAITHYHSDHIGDLGFLLNIGFTNGRRGPANMVQVHGPQGLNGITAGLRAFYRPDAYARIMHIIDGQCVHDGDPDVEDSLNFAANEFYINASRPIVPVFSAGGVNVSAVLVPHNSIYPAVGYLIQSAEAKIVISGDTTYSTLLESVSADADYLVHEVTNQTWAYEYWLSLNATGAPNANTFWCGGLVSHTPIEAVAGLAQRARVRNLVLSHIIPRMDPDDLSAAIRAAGYTYGNVHVATDGDYWKVLTHGR
jgi:ribonuclease Z